MDLTLMINAVVGDAAASNKVLHACGWMFVIGALMLNCGCILKIFSFWILRFGV